MQHIATGQLFKMTTQQSNPIQYSLVLSETQHNLNTYIGKKIKLNFTGDIRCTECGKLTKKSFGEGFCYSCFNSSANNSPCIIRPELCEAHLGKGRDIEWEQHHHLQPHVVYLSSTSHIKVGVTRLTQVPTRWIDQGALAAIVIAEVPYRRLAGEIEMVLKNNFYDKTHWKKMLHCNEINEEIMWNAFEKIPNLLPENLQQYYCANSDIQFLEYPIQVLPDKIDSINFDKQACVEETLIGIKGQYLMFESGNVINIRSMSGYVIEFYV